MWRTSGRFTSRAYISRKTTGNAFYRQPYLCDGKLANVLPKSYQKCTVRNLSNNGSRGTASSGVGKLILGTAVVATGTIFGGMYYVNHDPVFRKNIENKLPFSAALFNTVLGKQKSAADTTSPLSPLSISPPVSPKDNSEGQLLSPADKNIEPLPLGESDKNLSKTPNPAKESVEKESSAVEVLPARMLPKLRSQDNISASLSSIDQMAVSSVDLDISKAVERGVSEAQKDIPLVKKDAEKTSEDVGKNSKDSAKKKKKKKKKKEEKKVDVEDEELKTSLGAGKDSPPADKRSSIISAEMTAADVALQTAVATVSELGHKAIDSLEHAVAAVRHHRNSLQEALKTPETDTVTKVQWDTLTTLAASKTTALKQAEEATTKLGDIMDKVQVSISQAKEKGLEATAEVAAETMAKLTYALQQVKNQLRETQSEGTALKEFQDFIDKGKKQLKEELSSIKPEFQDSKLEDKADEALLAYAHKRIRLLEEALEQRGKQGHQVMQEALFKQQREDEKLAEIRLKHELEKLRTELNDLTRQKDAEMAELHEDDLRQQLRRQAAAFGDHLNDVLKVQANDLQVKHASDTREQLLLTRHEFDLKMRGALARLNGVITAVQNRADVEKLNTEAQKLWLASQSLSTAISDVGDARSRLYPIRDEVETIRQVAEGNEVVEAVLESLSEDVVSRGVFPEEALRRRFPNVRKVCKQVAMVGEEGGGLWSYLLSYLQSFLVFDTRAVKQPTSIDPEELDTYEVLALAASSLEEGNTEQAVKYMNQLRGQPRRVAKDWIEEARLFLEARQVARFLTSFASAYNIGVELQK